MRTVLIGDPALQPFASMYSVDRAQYGFTSLPKSGSVSIEGSSSSGDYDAMLHFRGKPSRTIAFRREGRAYHWIGEQEVFQGPRLYQTVDGQFHEQVVITFNKEAVQGQWQGLKINYFGPDQNLMIPKGERPNWSLTLAEVDPLLQSWGYRK